VLSDVLRRRRELDLRDLPIDMKVELIASRCEHVLPGLDQLASRLSEPGATLKFGIDPTGAEVHLGHAVPIILADRPRRLGRPAGHVGAVRAHTALIAAETLALETDVLAGGEELDVHVARKA